MSRILDLLNRFLRVAPWAAAAGLAAAISTSLARADVKTLTLYEKCGRAPVVLWGEVVDGDDRFATVKVLGQLKGSVPLNAEGAVRIVYRLDSFLRKPWQERIDFRQGERLLLFARPFTKADGEVKAPDLYTLMWGAEGKYLLPREGEAAHVEATRAFVSILAEADLDRQAARLEEAIGAENPLLGETALAELHRQGLGDLALIPRLIEVFGHERETRRALAMRLLARILEDAGIAGREVPDRDGLSDRLRGAAALDRSAAFRVEAVAALAHLGGEANVAFLRRIAREDPAQEVRYAAERWLLSVK